VVCPSVRFTGIAIGLLTLAIVGAWCWPTSSPRLSAQEAKDAKLKALLKERHAALKEIAAITARAYKDGAASNTEVIEAEQAALKAELDLGGSEKEQIAILEKLVTLARKHEEDAVGAVRKGIAPTSVAHKAKVSRLEAEIAMARVKSK